MRQPSILEKEGISAEVVDPRTILPLDEEIILQSVEKTGGAVIVHEAPTTGGFGGEIAALAGGQGHRFSRRTRKTRGRPVLPNPVLP